MGLWDSKVDKLSDSFTQLSNKVDDISSKTLTLSESLTNTQADLEKVLTTQEDFEDKYQEILRLVESLQEKEDMIESQQKEIEELKDLQVYQQREIEELQDYKEKSLDRDEVREQYGRKMNLWLYGLDQSSRGENTWDVVKKFSVDVLTDRHWMVGQSKMHTGCETPLSQNAQSLSLSLDGRTERPF